MKTFAVALLAASSSAFSTDFISGAQKGFFLQSDAQIKDFHCQAAEVDADIQKFLVMVPAMEMMMGTVNKGQKTNPMINLAIDAATSYGKIQTLMASDYEGSQFCQGLLLAHEAQKIVMELGTNMVTKQSEMLQ